MIVVERTFAVTAGPAAVVAYLRDFANTSQWDPSVVSTTRTGDGPIGPGVSWRQVSRVFGVTAELTYTLVTMNPEHLVFHGRNEGATCTETATVRSVANGSEVTYLVELEMHGLAKLATPLLKVECEKLGTAAVARLAATLDGLAVPAGPPPISEVLFPPAARGGVQGLGQEA